MMLIMPHMLMGTSQFRECSVSAYVRYHQCDTLSTQLFVAEHVKEYFNFRMPGECKQLQIKLQSSQRCKLGKFQCNCGMRPRKSTLVKTVRVGLACK